MFPAKNPIFRLINTLIIGVLGGLLFQWLHLPLPWMLGPLLANLILGLAGIPVGIKSGLRNAFLGGLGLILGGQTEPDTLARAAQWPGSLLLLSISVALTVMALAWYFRRVAAFDRASAWFSAVPGAMSVMVAMGGDAGGDERKIALVHALRMTMIVVLIPSLFWWFYTPPEGSVTALMPSNLWLLLGIPPAWWLARCCRIPTPEFTGPLLFSVATALAGYPFHANEIILAVVFLVLGGSIGARFHGTPMPELLWMARHALVATLLALSLALVFALLMTGLLEVPLATALLTMAPGGVGEMGMVALAMGVDPVFVAAHHLFRLLALMLIVPLLVRYWREPEAS